MEFPLAYAYGPVSLGLRVVAATCSITENMLLVCSRGAKDAFLVVVNGKHTEVVQVCDLAPDSVDAPVKKLRFLTKKQTLYALCGAQLRVLHFNGNKNLFGGGQLLNLTNVTDFDVVGVAGATLLAAIEGLTLRLFMVTLDEYLRLSEIRIPDGSRCKWVSGECVCIYGHDSFTFYGYDGTLLHQVCSGCISAEAVGPLLEVYEFNDATHTHLRLSQWAVVIGIPDVYFAHRLVVFQLCGGNVTQRLHLPLFAPTPPKFVCSVGPWIAVGGDFGVEFYEQSRGVFGQSFLDTVSVITCSWANSPIEVDRCPQDGWFSQPRFGLAVASSELVNVELRSTIDVVDELMYNVPLNAEMIESLMKYGHSVRARYLMRGYPQDSSVPPGDEGHLGAASGTSALLSQSFLFSEYGGLLSEFMLPYRYLQGSGCCSTPSRETSPPWTHWVVGPHCDERCPVTTMDRSASPNCCRICGRGIQTKTQIILRRCRVCVAAVCTSCSTMRCLGPLGYPRGVQHVGESVVCVRCDGACDINLYRLFMARRYPQILQYIEQFSERCFKFSLDHVLPPVVAQCFAERKHDLAAWILERYVPHSSPMWSQWISQFAIHKCMDCLLAFYTPTRDDSPANTGLLLQLVKNDAEKLLRLVHQWPLDSFCASTLRLGIEARLRFKVQEAKDIQRDSQLTQDLSVTEVIDAVSTLYFDGDVFRLLRVHLHLCFAEKCYLDAACAYTEYYYMLKPPPDFVTSPRPRSTREVFDGALLGGTQPISQAERGELMDLWDLITTHGVLEDLLRKKDSSGKTLLLIPVFVHFRLSLGQYLVRVVSPSSLADILSIAVDELKDSQPEQLLHVLHTLTSISAAVTSRYHALMSSLYLQFMPEKLLAFVQNPQVSELNWRKLAFEVEKRRMFAELVYIIGRTGNDMEAIRIAIRCLKDVPLAVQYIKDHPGDSRLWESLVQHTTQSPVLIGDFFDCVEDTMNAADLLRAIPEKNRLEIDRFGPRVFRVLNDRRRIAQITESALGGTREDALGLSTAFRSRAACGVRCVPSQCCGVCNLEVVGEFVIGGCGHSFHNRCVEMSARRASDTAVTSQDRWRAAVKQRDSKGSLRTLAPNRPVIRIDSRRWAGRGLCAGDVAAGGAASAYLKESVFKRSPALAEQSGHRRQGTQLLQSTAWRPADEVDPGGRVERELEYFEYRASRLSGVRSVLRLLPDGPLYLVLSYLPVSERERCRAVSRTLRRIVASFLLFGERHDQSPTRVFRARFGENGMSILRSTVHTFPISLYLGNPYSTVLSVRSDGVECAACANATG